MYATFEVPTMSGFGCRGTGVVRKGEYQFLMRDIPLKLSKHKFSPIDKFKQILRECLSQC